MLDPQVLARILIIQNLVGNLPDENSIFSFVCRGLTDVPGIRSVVFFDADTAPHESGLCKPVQMGGVVFGYLVFDISDQAEYSTYQPYVENFCFMVAVIVEGHRQRTLIERHRADLENKVLERTRELESELAARRRAEATLRESELQFRSIFENSVEALGVSWRGTTLMVNPAYLKLFGFTDPAKLLGSSILNLFAPEERDRIHDYVERRSRNEDVPNFYETVGQRQDGTVFEMDVHASTFPTGDQYNTLVVLRDISERKKAAQAIAKEKERLAVTLRSIGDGVITTDIHGLVDGMNRVAEALTGWTAVEAKGRPLPEIFSISHELTGEPCENPVDQVLKTHRIVSLANHSMLVSRDGQHHVVEDSGAPIFDAESRIIGVVLVFRDSTEKRKLLEAVQRDEKLHSLGILAGGIAHDFNNLLGGLFGYLRLALDASAEGTPARAYLQKSLPVYDRVKALTQQLLTFAKGGQPILKSGSLGKTLRTSVEFALSGSNVVARFQIADDLWSCDYDENQIGQVVDNLVINAKEAMPNGGTVEVLAQNQWLEAALPGLRPGPYLVITITDQGPGIPRETLPRIFDPFFTTKPKGSGLGLATSYSIVDRHGGHLDVSSEVGRGTSFTVHLPAKAEAAPSPVHDETVRRRSRGRVLVLDDEEFLLDVTKEMLESMGYAVATSTSGKGALKLLGEPGPEPFSFVLTDLTVPGGMGGVEILAELRKRNDQTPVIATSGYSEDPVIADPARFGFAGSLSKPYLTEDLAALLNRIFR